jgi:NitT/TauT family transport system permease protein
MRRLLAPTLAFLLVLIFWEGAVHLFELQPWLLPAPTAVLDTMVAQAPRLAAACWRSACGALGGLLASVMLGSATALAFAASGVLRRALYPWAVVLQTVPIVAIAPLIVIWAGTGLRSVILVATIVSLFPIVTAGTNGLLRVRREELELFEVHGARPLDVLLRLRLPHALPDLLVGTRVAAGLAVVGTVVGELMVGYGAGTASLGTIVLTSSSQLDTALLFAAIILATVLGVVIVAIVGNLANRVLLARGEAAAVLDPLRDPRTPGGTP